MYYLKIPTTTKGPGEDGIDGTKQQKKRQLGKNAPEIITSIFGVELPGAVLLLVIT